MSEGSPRTRVAILWHMHQPWYVNPLTQKAELPWVRLHGTKDYLDMPLLAARFPRLRLTFNLVPSLLAQLEDLGAGRVVDEHLRVSRMPVAELSPEEKHFVTREFFSADLERMVGRFPRYRELADRRAPDGAVSPPFTDEELLDLEVLFHLAWVDPLFLADEPFASLAAKGRGYTEEEKHRLLDASLEILRRIPSTYRRLEEEGRVEISTTPFYHPILPLLIDSASLLDAMPGATPLDPPFRHPEDAEGQVAEAAVYHAKLFCRAPRGMWPSEGSVSEDAARLIAGHGFRWIATDEAILFRALARAGMPTARSAIDRPWRFVTDASGGGIGVFFRDHELSDLIGFTYRDMDPFDAAQDFLARIRERGKRSRAEGVAEPVISVILDGENCWERYLDDGKPFLEALYRGFEEADDLATVTFQEVLDGAHGELPVLPSLPAGSWIDGNFAIWAGHEEDRAAWRLVSHARASLFRAQSEGTLSIAAAGEAWRCLHIAEGSDWFWWYGDEHSTVHGAEFDRLFREHLRRILEITGEEPPADLLQPVFRRRAPKRLSRGPRGLLRPVIDGRDTDYFEWLDAGRVQSEGSSMHAGASAIERLLYGSDGVSLHLRVEFRRDPLGSELEIQFLSAGTPRSEIRVSFSDNRSPEAFLRSTESGTTDSSRSTLPLPAAYDAILELSCPLDRISDDTHEVHATVSVVREGRTVEIWPSQGSFVIHLHPELSGDDAW